MNESLTHETSASIEFTGKAIKFSGNMATRTLYMYHCIRCTTLGPEILAETFPKGVKYLSRLEYIDFLMHHLGFFVMVGILVKNTENGLNKTNSAMVWAFCLAIALIYYLHVYYIFLYYTLPLRTAGKVGLIIPLNAEESIGSFQNEFVTITAAQNSKYHCSENQNMLLSIAISRHLELKLMIYNKAWNFRNINFAGSMNVFSHLWVILIMGMVRPGQMTVAAIVTYIVYYVLYWTMLSRENECWRALLSGIFNAVLTCCGFFCCQSSKSEADLIARLKDNIENGTLKQSEDVTHIKNNCFNGYI
jgi:hypothetical protein